MSGQGDYEMADMGPSPIPCAILEKSKPLSPRVSICKVDNDTYVPLKGILRASDGRHYTSAKLYILKQIHFVKLHLK